MVPGFAGSSISQLYSQIIAGTSVNSLLLHAVEGPVCCLSVVVGVGSRLRLITCMGMAYLDLTPECSPEIRLRVRIDFSWT
jgi:hypothetical protein